MYEADPSDETCHQWKNPRMIFYSVEFVLILSCFDKEIYIYFWRKSCYKCSHFLNVLLIESLSRFRSMLQFHLVLFT